ncbi:hypothetical protein Nepgr_008144 [Nepenthes gracilis]|uniref:Protein RER1 n=1 Tax=Nepenthes gracilis TaxID=150966 RepID=A0AAD3S8C6_NEPGR|nr:hypothetical protein Nepgr_008144 [Nepenthes gracilis]
MYNEPFHLYLWPISPIPTFALISLWESTNSSNIFALTVDFMDEAGVASSDNAVGLVPLAKWRTKLAMRFRYYLDRSAPHTLRRWLATLGAATIYILRVYYVKGFYVVSYGLATYVLNLLIGFLSPEVDPELEGLDGASSSTKDSDEYRPFIRRLPEFKLWYSITKAFMVSFAMTFLSVLDVPVFWPILSSYWIFLFVLTMKRQIVHMIKHKYNPFTTGKPRYGKKD